MLFSFTPHEHESHTESDDSPGIYLRDDFLGGPTELRAPTAERAALFLDSALAGRLKSSGTGNSSSSTATLESALIFTLHVYQYSLSRKGGGKSYYYSATSATNPPSLPHSIWCAFP